MTTFTKLTKASHEWASRPADQRFKSLEDLDRYCHQEKETAKVARVPLSSIRVEAQEGDMTLVGRGGIPATFTNWSFGQLCTRIAAPASYLRGLPATLAAQNVNHGLAKINEQDPSLLYFHNGAGLKLHAVTSEKYTRIYDADITERLIRLTQDHPEWQPAPPAFDDSRGLYASDHDLFAFMVNNGRRIFEKDPNGGLSRGFFVWNSEVGAASFGVMAFLYEYVCGNHLVWGASGIQELRIRHIGDADERAFRELAVELRRYADSSVTEDEAKIEQAKQYRIAATKDEVLDAIFSRRITGLGRGTLETAYQRAQNHSDWYGDPRTVWGMVNGITEEARESKFADNRVQLERAAGKIMEMAF